MINKTMDVGLVIAKHTASVPTRLSDYDYDPGNPCRRFISTYLHKIYFLDKITEAELLSIEFDSLTCAEFISAFNQFSYDSGVYGLGTEIRNVHISNGPNCICDIRKNIYDNCDISFVINNEVMCTITVIPNIFLSLLESEELDEMFVEE